MDKHTRHIFLIAILVGILAFAITFTLVYFGYLPERFTSEQMSHFGSISAFSLYVFLGASLIFFIVYLFMLMFKKKVGEGKTKERQRQLIKYCRAVVMICFAFTMTSVDVPLYIWIPAVILSLLFGLDSILS